MPVLCIYPFLMVSTINTVCPSTINPLLFLMETFCAACWLATGFLYIICETIFEVQSVWDMLLTEWQWERFSSKSLGFLLGVSSHRCSVHSFILIMSYQQGKRAKQRNLLKAIFFRGGRREDDKTMFNLQWVNLV